MLRAEKPRQIRTPPSSARLHKVAGRSPLVPWVNSDASERRLELSLSFGLIRQISLIRALPRRRGVGSIPHRARSLALSGLATEVIETTMR